MAANEIHPPIGEKPEGDLDALGKLEDVTKKLFANLDRLGENIKKLKEENKRLRELCGITVSEEPLILTPDMEVKDGHK
jgi:hypothetical protein